MIPAESWFPTPRGGALKEWAADYKKAALLVGSMTLIEKVNITTGTGWRMGLCVGNTGMSFHVPCANVYLHIQGRPNLSTSPPYVYKTGRWEYGLRITFLLSLRV